MYWSRRTVVAIPVAMLLLGGVAGWFMRDDTPTSSTNGTVVGKAIPTGAALDAAAPVRALGGQMNTMVIDRTTLVGYPTSLGTSVPTGAALPLGAAQALEPVDPRTLEPAVAVAPVPAAPAEPETLGRAQAPVAPPRTLPPADPTTTLPPGGGGTFRDPCLSAKGGCPGGEGRIQAPTATTSAPNPADTLQPLTASMPFAATGWFSTMCDTIEQGTLPDTALDPGARPTIAVVVNQPSSIAVSGTWGDGTALAKLTLATSAQFDQQWQDAWKHDHVQKSLLECITLPVDDVRAHAAGGRAPLQATVLAISATGRTELDGALTLTVPLDGEDAPFADSVLVGSLGEQVQEDGTLAPAVHVHYALLDDKVVPTTSRLNARTAKVYGSHALVENADCAGWANNQGGVDRTSASTFTVTRENRTINGKARSITVVDGDLTLDPTLPGGWKGYACVRVFVADSEGHKLNVALRGAKVRGPRTADYRVGVVLDPTQWPEGAALRATWTDTNGVQWCGPTEVTPKTKGAECATSARAQPKGIRLVLQPRDSKGVLQPAFVATVPVNTAYCNTDDAYASLSDGCSTGYTQSLKISLSGAGRTTGVVTLVVRRDAGAGSIVNSPSQAWQIDATESFLV
jgi:hypothetical protein